MTIKLVPVTSYGFAHVCDRCGATGPVVGDFKSPIDLSESKLTCSYQSDCTARRAGWQTSEREDVCPACLKKGTPT